MSQAIKTSRSGSQGGIPIGRNVQTGDPGLFGSLFSGIKTLGRAAIGVATGGPAGGIRSLLPSRGIGPAAPRGVSLPGLLAGAQRAIPGGETGLGAGCPSGHRPNKTAYFLRDGSFVDVGTRCVKNRRRNPANARATSRAISRINGAKRMQSTLASIETAKYTKAGKKKHHH